MTKKVLFLTLLLFASLATLNRQYAHSNSAQPPLGRTGAPGELTCATSGCHGGAPNTGPGSATIFFAGDGSGSSYTPGSTYVIGVVINNGGGTGSRYGFEMVALNSSNQSVGTFIGNTPNFTATAVQSSTNRQYIFHKNVPNPNAGNFTMQWTAPATDQGPITFYLAANSANGNGLGSGDLVYTTTLQIQPVPVGIETALQNNTGTIEVYPNPVTGNTANIAFALEKPQNVQILLYHINGQLLETLYTGQQPAGNQQQQVAINRSNYPEGLYLLVLQTETGATQTQKIWLK
ncbi:T9SS C-terminal target domain-containing protein [Sphingobacteriales bacterium UPWRP_1]|nr:hypothetical protein BVG80_02015 [Sphingobacteriales bacterium TSM_CSM]PSJ75137.1 T9SS C-terminal target domain-containing protein [Sphingobacteriales bacterium UPWRP_1]